MKSTMELLKMWENYSSSGASKNTPRGAPGRVPTAYGSLASAHSQWIAAVPAERKAFEIQKKKRLNRIARENAETVEMPVVQFLTREGFLEIGGKLLRKTLIQFYDANRELSNKYNISKSSSRQQLVNGLMMHINAETT